MALLWHFDIDPPNTCKPCQSENHDRHMPFFNAEIRTNPDKGLYGPFSCDCLCDDDNIEASIDELFEDIERMVDDDA